MRRILLLFILIISVSSYGQEIKISRYEKLQGICNPENVVARFSIFTYTRISNKKIKRIEKELNLKIRTLKAYSNLSEERIINLVVNCKGEVLKSNLDERKIQPQLKFEIENAFMNLKIWKKEKYNGKTDSSILITFKIENGKISIN